MAFTTSLSVFDGIMKQKFSYQRNLSEIEILTLDSKHVNDLPAQLSENNYKTIINLKIKKPPGRQQLDCILARTRSVAAKLPTDPRQARSRELEGVDGEIIFMRTMSNRYEIA